MAATAAARADSRLGNSSPLRLREVVLGLAGLASGLSAFANGFYERSQFGPVAIVLMLVLMTTLVAVDRWPRPSVLVPAAGLAALAIVQYASSTWAESGSQAVVEAHRTVLYAGVTVALVLLLDDVRSRVFLLAGVTAGALVVLAYDAVALLGATPDAFFLGRLDAPLGYVNGQAFLLLLVLWPGVALAERAPRPWQGAPGIFLATLGFCLSLVIQSRGALVGLAFSALVALAVLPGRARRLGALAVVGVSTFAASGVLLRVYDRAVPATGQPAPGTARDAALAALAAAAVGGLAWLALAPAGVALSRLLSPLNRRSVRQALAAAGVLVAVGAVGAAVAGGTASDVWRDFKSLEPVSKQGRLATGGGNRYDYWRVAVQQWREHPLKGVGAGNYDSTYFRDRRTAEDIRQPHSLELQVLAETGVLGALPLAAFVIAIGAGLLRARRGWVARSPGERGVVVVACGTFTLWLGQTSVDWLHLLPGLTMAALASAAVLVSEPQRRPPARFAGPSLRPLAFAAGALAIASLGVSTRADHYRAAATDELRRDPAQAVRSARRAIELDTSAVQSYIVLSAAEARLGRYEQAREALQEAERRKPSDPVVPALLGDLAMRRGLPAVARANYARAARLNPRDERLRTLAGTPSPDTAP